MRMAFDNSTHIYPLLIFPLLKKQNKTKHHACHNYTICYITKNIFTWRTQAKSHQWLNSLPNLKSWFIDLFPWIHQILSPHSVISELNYRSLLLCMFIVCTTVASPRAVDSIYAFIPTWSASWAFYFLYQSQLLDFSYLLLCCYFAWIPTWTSKILITRTQVLSAHDCTNSILHRQFYFCLLGRTTHQISQ